MLGRRWIIIPVTLLLTLALFALTAAQDAAPSPQPYLGIFLASGDGGIRVERVVPDGPADQAGVQADDLITAIAGDAVTADTVRDVLAKHAAGDTVTLDIERGGETLSLDVTLGEQPASAGTTIEIMPGMASLLGLNLEQTDEGLVVREVTPDSLAASAGFQVGDIITRIGDTEITQASDILLALRNLDPGQPLAVEVQRGGEAVALEITLDDFSMPFGQGMPFGDGNSFEMPFAMMGGGARLGVSFLTLDAQVAQEHNLTQTEGALIMEVTADSPADKAGVQADDIVTAVDGDRVDSERTLRDRLLAYEPGDKVTLSVLRGGDTLDVQATLDQADYSGMMMPGFRFFSPDGRGMGRGFMHPPVPGMPGQPDAQPEVPAQPNL